MLFEKETLDHIPAWLRNSLHNLTPQKTKISGKNAACKIDTNKYLTATKEVETPTNIYSKLSSFSSNNKKTNEANKEVAKLSEEETNLIVSIKDTI